MSDPTLIMAALAGVGLAASAGPLGCFVMWRRMAYFGDAVAHASILGVALALAAAWPVLIGIVLTCMATALILHGLEGRKGQTTDMLLGVLAHTGLACGMIFLSLTGEADHGDVEHYLFGEIMSITLSDLAVIWSGSIIILLVLLWRWNRLLTASLNMELAGVSGISPRFDRLVLTMAMALIIAMAIHVVGALLIISLLIIPAATARAWSSSPESMAVLAALGGAIACLAGLAASILLNIPTGPAIIAIAGLGFLLTNIVQFPKI